jgi:serine/threonine protein kinase
MSGAVRDPSGTDPMALEGVPAIGSVIESKYEIERLLGVGGMGVVVAARHIHLGQRVAIKFMRGIAAEDSSAVGRFLREARAVVALSSEHVAKVIDVGTLDAGGPYIVMEYLSGVDLGDLLRQHGPMSVPNAVNAILQACEAIAEAHAIGIIHRDLKPANLFVSRHVDGSPLVKVLDFGISKRSDFDAALGRSTLTPSGYLMGSPAYMSPEQVRNPKAVDARTDIWAMGVILYEVLTGVAPFSGETVGETLARIVSEPPRPVRSLRPDLPEGLAQVIAQCLDRVLDQRVRTVGELAVKLSPFAPRESALSVERIVRISGGIQATVNLGGGMTPMSQHPVSQHPVSQHPVNGTQTLETSRQWVRSGATPMPNERSRGGVVLTGAVVGLVVAVGAIGAYTLVGRSGSRTTASEIAETVPAAAVAAPAATAVAAPTVTAAPTIAPPANQPDNADLLRPPGVGDNEAKRDAGSSFPGWAAEDRVPETARPGAIRPPTHRPRPPTKPPADPSPDGLFERRQ